MSPIREPVHPADSAAQLIAEVFRRHGHTRRLTRDQIADIAREMGLEPPADRDVMDAIVRAVGEPVRWTDFSQDVATALFDAARTRQPLAVAGTGHMPSVLFVPIVLERSW
ncbi:hypothetical protein [Streptomyces ipomoeae]|uniref:hypothetical protein n=1 Tax=Streptomyces ipomoeae TaxID=103232 RepID=UPI0011471CFB|nr:hypothetical protein [Streptomyces ipomoeae]TQE33140.1 hypothetical protein Sipo7851_21850 [Streptomyces ipomoeae]